VEEVLRGLERKFWLESERRSWGQGTRIRWEQTAQQYPSQPKSCGSYRCVHVRDEQQSDQSMLA
jgi:hypothetical protein